MALTLPNAAVRALTEDELKTAKDVLVARAASATRVPPERLASQLLVAAGEWVPALQFAVQGLAEVRSSKIEAVIRPFKEGMTLPPAPQPVAEPFDVWSVPVPPRTNPPPKDFILIGNSLEKKDCQSCLGKASVPCKVCFAKGGVNCDVCMGAGSQPCGICKGLSRISCPDCEGTGRIKAGGMTNRVLGPCGSCNGIGKFNCNHCAGGKVDCATCGNTGKKSCAACGGAGKQNCTVCGGAAKVVHGKGFQVEYRPMQAQSVVLGAPGPQGVDALALAQKSAPVGFDFPSEDAFRKDVAASSLPEGVKGGLEQLLSRVRPSGGARMGALKLAAATGAVWRLTGAFAGHEFIYWIHPTTHSVVAEKDPMGQAGQKSLETAQAALRRGDWETAVDAAKETLSLDPHHAEARGIAAQWRQKQMREALVLGGAGGAVGALLSTALIYGADKGLYRFGPALLSAALCAVVGVGAAFALTPVLRHVFPLRRRLLTGAGATAGAVLLFLGAAWGVVGWNPVRSADQKALNQELARTLQFGDSATYQPAELTALQKLYEKYEHSRAELGRLNDSLQKQIVLKTEYDAMNREFHEKLDEILASSLFWDAKKARIQALKEHYALRSLDVSDADKAVAALEAQAKKAVTAPAPRARGKISITPLKRAPAKAAPAKKGKKSSSSVRPPPKFSAPARPAKKSAKKKIKPNKEVEPAKKKKGKTGLFGGKFDD